MKILLYFSFLVFLLCVFGCATPEKKPRIEKVVQYERVLHKYPNSLYLVGTGESALSEENYKDVAESRARANLAKQIKVKVQEVIETDLLQRGEEVISNAEIFSKSIVDSMELKGTEIVYSGADEGIYRAICILSRESAGKWLKEDMDNAYNSSQNHFNSAKLEIAKGNIVLALKELNKAKDFYIKGEAYKEEYNIISHSTISPHLPKATLALSVINYDSIDLFFETIASNIKIEKLKGDNQKGTQGTGLSEPLVVRVSYKDVPVKDFPVSFEFESGEGEIDKFGTSNSDGEVISKVNKIPYVEDAIVISKPELKNILTPPFKIDKSVTFRILLERTVLDIESAAEKLVKQLEKGISEKSEVSVNELYYRDSKLCSSFSRYFTTVLERCISKSDKFSLISYRSIEPGEALSIMGNYWEFENWIDIDIKLKDKAHKVISSAVARIERKPVESEGLTLKPESYDELKEKTEYLEKSSSFSRDLRVQVWTERKVYKEGENLSIFVKATDNCYIRVFDYQSSGEVVVLFPNEYYSSGYIEGNKVYEIPQDLGGFKLVITPPFGSDVIKVYATKKPLSEIPLPQYYTGKSGPYDVYKGSYRGIDRGVMVSAEEGLCTASCIITTIR